MCQFIMLRKDLIGTISERALILYALMCDRMKSSEKREQFHDSSGKAFIIFTRDEVERTFNVKHCTAAALFAELETAGLIVRTKSSINSACKIYITSEKTDAITSEKTDAITSEKTDAYTSEISDANHTNHNHTNHNHLQQNNSEICENQQTFDDLFLMMTVKDVVAEILCQLVAKNPQEFAEINAEIINFVAENIRNAAENKKIVNLTGYARAALRRGKADYDASCDAGSSKTDDRYGATYDISLYENYSAADNPEWNND